jgi:uncharacterized protein YjbJ (UPF0337 family)
MNWEQVKGNWKQVKGRIKQQWGRLTDDELDVIDGRRDVLVGRVQEAYGITKQEAERQIRDWERIEDSAEADDELIAGDPTRRTAGRR